MTLMARVTAACLLLAATPSVRALPSIAVDVQSRDSSDPVDCGTSSLYYLLRLYGRAVPFDEVRRHLSGNGKSHRSMQELQLAGDKLGLRLVGVKLADKTRTPDCPMIAFLNRTPHGHFIVVNAVGHSGRLVQVLDGVNEPIVLDAERLLGSPEWTGLVLLPDRFNMVAPIAAGVAIMSGIGLVMLLILPRGLKREKIGVRGKSGWWPGQGFLTRNE